MPTAPQRTFKCPNCQGVVPSTARQCPSCKLQVAQMRAFAAAKEAARRKGKATTQVEEPPTEASENKRRLVLIAAGVVAFILAAILAYPLGSYVGRLFASGPAAWTKLPKTQTDAAKEILADISMGDAGYDKAYGLIAPSAKKPKDSDDIGRYRQLFHVMNNYLSSEISSDWISIVSLQVDKNNPDMIEAHIGPETLHVRAKLETPADKLKDDNHHYAIEGIDEFDIHDAAGMQQMAGIGGVLRGYGAEGSLKQLEAINAAMGGGNRHESPMQRKLRLLPTLHDPRNISRRAMLQTWPLRHDPVIRARLTSISNDQRYPTDVIETAKQVLQDNVPDEDLIAAGVSD